MSQKMEVPIRNTPCCLSKPQAFAAAAVLVLCAVLSPASASLASTKPRLSSVEPRLPGVEPRLSFSPSLIEPCVTPVVTLECSTKAGRSLEARIAAPDDDGNEDNKKGVTGNVKISSIKIFKMDEMAETEEDRWEVFAELGDLDSPTGPALDDPEVEVRGKVGGSIEESYLRVIWDTASEQTFGVYRCDVQTSQPGSGSNVVSTEPLSLDYAQSDGSRESGDQLLNSIHELKAERKKEEEWRKKVDEGLELISQSIKLLDRFARGNAYKLNRIMKKMNDLTTSLNTRKETTTTTRTPASSPTTTTTASHRTFAPLTGRPDVTKRFVMLGIAGGKPRATPSPETRTTARGKGRKAKGKKDKKRKNKNKRRKTMGKRVG
ncbi:hypothetical protein ElyMa_001792900 [Elysia marginata]|uniref:Uncharacterized protein n=1 Tax=Elysia marginata TaxID=1093978 RepID=A0AAV4EEH7_9GAST|nr:hypothetical protein ElyMa_001792900 [Elysia marginata]